MQTSGDDDMPLNFKFVSVGQSLVDTAVVAQTLRGNALKPLAPVNVRGHRDAANNLFIEWTRRARIASGLRPSVGMPLAEEVEVYIVEVYTGSTLLNSYTVRVPPAITPFLLNRTNVDSAGIPDPLAARHVTTQNIDLYRSYVEGTVDPSTVQLVGLTVGTMDSFDDGSGGIMWSSTFLMDAGVDSVNGLYVGEQGVLKYTQGVGYADASARIRVAVVDGHAQYFLNPTGSDDRPLYISQLDIDGREMHGFFFDADGTITDHKFKRSLPYLLYTASQQTNDTLTPGNPVKVRVYQVSQIVGRGAYVEATL